MKITYLRLRVKKILLKAKKTKTASVTHLKAIVKMKNHHQLIMINYRKYPANISIKVMNKSLSNL